MSRRPLAVLTLALVTLSLAACSDVTAPTSTAQRRLQPNAPSNAGGTLDASGRR